MKAKKWNGLLFWMQPSSFFHFAKQKKSIEAFRGQPLQCNYKWYFVFIRISLELVQIEKYYAWEKNHHQPNGYRSSFEIQNA